MTVEIPYHGEIPVTIGLFVDPGTIDGAAQPKNRNLEYDAFNDRYANFLLDEIIPQVTDRYSITSFTKMPGVIHTPN